MTILAIDRSSAVTVGGVLLEHPRRGLAVDVRPALEGLLEVHVARHVGQDAQLDLGVVRGEQHAVRSPATNAWRIGAQLGPDGDVLEVRVGGDSRPVAATACWNVVCRRPVRGSSSSGSASM